MTEKPVTEKPAGTAALDPAERDLHLRLLRQMMEIRAFENAVFELLAQDLLRGASHVYAGEEAVAVGACAAVGPEDYITSTHRGHGHCLARGGNLNLMMAELCGKATGYCRGRGGSMHIADTASGNLGATGIVGANIPVAAGAGLACRMNARGQVVLCFFGDGATNNGAFHESLNLAGLWRLPVIFICENNLYGMSVPVTHASAVPELASRAAAYAMPGLTVDGQRVLEVKSAVEQAVQRARKGEGPTLIEAKTYRYRGHSRSDPRKYRSREEEAFWRRRDPIALFRDDLVAAGQLTSEEFDRMQAEVDGAIRRAREFALQKSPCPDPRELYDDVYAGWRYTDRRIVKA